MVPHRFFFYLAVLSLPVQLGFHFWPAWAQVLGRRIDYLSPTLYLTDILVWLTLVSWIFSSIRGFNMYDLRCKNKKIFFLGLLISFNVYFAVNQQIAIYAWLKALEFVLFCWYIARTKPNLSRVTQLLSFGVLYSSLIATAQFLLQHSIGGPLWFLGERTFDVNTPGIATIQSCQLSAVSCQQLLRAYATFPLPNVLGGFLAVTLPIIALRGWEERKLGRKFFVTSFVAGFIALVLTFSRSAWAVFGLAILGMFIFGRMKKVASQNVSPRFIVGVFGLILFIGTWAIWLIRDTSESVVVRQELASSAVILWQQAPLVGVGLGNFLIALPHALVSRSIYFLQPVHNIYLLILAETGIIGLGLFLWFIWFIMTKIKKIFSIWHLSFIILLTLGLIDHYPLTIQQGQLLLSLLVGLVFSL